MIFFDGEIEKIDLEKDEIKELVRESLNEAKDIFSYFISLFNFDTLLFDHLFNIDIIVDNSSEFQNDDLYGQYCVDDNLINDASIRISYNLVKSVLNKTKKKEELIITLLHEIIHFNRTIYLNDSLHLDDTISIDNNELNSLIELKYKLSKINFLNDTGNYTILNTKEINTNNYIIDTYNKKDNAFDIFYTAIESKNVNDIKAFIEKNYDKISKHRINIPDKRRTYDIIMNFYTLSHNFSLPLSEEEKMEYNYLIGIQIGLEEGLTECLSNIMYIQYNNKSYDIDDICNIIYHSNKSDYVRLTAYLLREADDNLIKWFLISCYEDCYIDRFSLIFKKEYTTLLEYFDILFNFNNNDKTFQLGKSLIMEHIKK